jgi:hypothetical protein
MTLAAPSTDHRADVMSWWPVTLVLLTLIGVAVLMGTVAYLFTSFGILTACTSEPVPDVEAYCTPTERWLLAGPAGQAVLVLAAAAALIVAIRRPAARLRVLYAGVVGLPLSLAWTALVTVIASASY